MKRTITIPIATPVSALSPQFPVGNTSPRPRAATHALSSPFGRTYIASSARRRGSSMSSASPARKPGTQKDGLEMMRAVSQCGTRRCQRGEAVRRA